MLNHVSIYMQQMTSAGDILDDFYVAVEGLTAGRFYITEYLLFNYLQNA